MPGDDCLPGFLVHRNPKRRILLSELGERGCDILLVCCGFRLDRNRDHRLGKLHGLEHDQVFAVAQGVTCAGISQPDRRADVARPDLGEFLSLVGVHFEQAADPLGLSGRRVDYR